MANPNSADEVRPTPKAFDGRRRYCLEFLEKADELPITNQGPFAEMIGL